MQLKCSPGVSCLWHCECLELSVDVAHLAAESAGDMDHLWILGLVPWHGTILGSIHGVPETSMMCFPLEINFWDLWGGGVPPFVDSCRFCEFYRLANFLLGALVSSSLFVAVHASMGNCSYRCGVQFHPILKGLGRELFKHLDG